jgi:hypothetical protein
VSISVKDEADPEDGSRPGRPHLFAVPNSSERPRSMGEGLDAKSPASWRKPEPPPSLSPGRLSAPRVPSFASAVPGATSALPDSLSPGASVWPDRLSAGKARRVPLVFAIVASAVSLLLGGLGGILVSDAFDSEPLSVARASLPSSFVGSESAPPEAAVGAEEAVAVIQPSTPNASSKDEPEPARRVPAKSAPATGKGASGESTPSKPEAEPFPAPDNGSFAATPGRETEAPATALGERLTSAEIQRTIYRYQPSVRHGCWQRQLANRDPSAPSTAKVTVTLTIAPNGKVTKASTSGEARGYPGLSGCISGKVKSWTFPKALGRTTAQVPFTFAAQ